MRIFPCNIPMAYQRPHLYWATYRVLSKSLEHISKDLQFMPQHPLINCPPLDRLLHKTSKNRISVLVLSHLQSFIFIPLVLSSPVTVTEYTVQSTEYRVHTTFFKNHFFGLLGPRNLKISQNLNIDFFYDDNTLPHGSGPTHVSPTKRKQPRSLVFR